LSLWFYNKKNSLGYYLGLLSVVLIVVALMITLIVLVPIDNEIKNWSSTNLPTDWEGIRHKWETFHAMRTFASLASFAFFSLCILAHPDRK